jgi:hypothetical protein
MFVIDAVPAPANEDCKDIAGAKVHVWVLTDCMKSAKTRAVNCVERYLWEVKSFEHELEISQEAS